MISTLKNHFVWYTILWLFYRLHGTLYPSGAFYSQIVLFLLILWSIYHFGKIIKMTSRPSYFEGLEKLIFMYIFYGVLLFITDGMVVKAKAAIKPPTYLYLETYLISLLPICSFYFYTITGKLTQKLLMYIVPVFVAVSISEFYRTQAEMIQLILENRNRLVEEVTNNGGYIIASVLPALFVYRRNMFIQYSFLLLCSIFILMSMKRGAILISAICIMFVVYDNMRNAKKTQIFTIVSLLVAVSCVFMYFFNDMMSSSDYFLERLEDTKEGNTSSRDELYGEFISFFIEKANILQQVVGLGANGTLKISFNYAHNDWLETLTNQGLLGILIFVTYWKKFFTTSRSHFYSKESRYVLMTIFFTFFVKTFFSMSIGDMTTYTNCILGFALADGFKKHDTNETYIEKI